MRIIHSLRLEGDFGFLGDSITQRHHAYLPGMAATSRTWPDMFLCDRTARTYMDWGYISKREADILSALPSHLKDGFVDLQPHLMHMGDIMHNGNLILDPRTNEIIAVVDYVESMAGDPRYELAWFDYYFSQYYDPLKFDMQRFRVAYGTDHDPNDRVGRFYLLAVLIFEKLLYFDPRTPRGEWAVAKAKEILAWFDRNRW